jgi:hypothetical protein
VTSALVLVVEPPSEHQCPGQRRHRCEAVGGELEQPQDLDARRIVTCHRKREACHLGQAHDERADPHQQQRTQEPVDREEACADRDDDHALAERAGRSLLILLMPRVVQRSPRREEKPRVARPPFEER